MSPTVFTGMAVGKGCSPEREAEGGGNLPGALGAVGSSRGETGEGDGALGVGESGASIFSGGDGQPLAFALSVAAQGERTRHLQSAPMVLEYPSVLSWETTGENAAGVSRN